MAVISAFSKFVLLFVTAHLTRALNSPAPVVHTVSNVTLISGREATLTCKYNRTVYAVYWRYESATSPMELLVVLDKHYEDGKRSGPGYEEGRFNITDDYSLIIRNVKATDEGKFICEVSDYETGSVLRNHTDVTTVVIAERPFIRIEQCEDDADEIHEHCVLHMTSEDRTVQLTCTVVGVKPLVDLTWEASISSEHWKQVMNRSTLINKARANGIFDQTLTVNVDASHIKSNKQHFSCVAKGLAVDGMANYTIAVFPAQGSNVTRTVVISVVCTLLFTFVIIGVVWIWWRMRDKYMSKKDPGNNDDEGASIPLNPGNKDDEGASIPLNPGNKDDEGASIPLNPGNNDNEDVSIPLTPKPDRRPLLERREEIREYRPSTPTTTNKDTNCINIGVFGIVTAGKSSFINSLVLALTGNYPAADVGATAADNPKYDNFNTESIRLTDHINIINFKRMINFDLDQLATFYREIRGKEKRTIRDIFEDTSKIKVYCPLFICDYSNFKERRHGCREFMRRFSEDVYSYFGRGITVVVTKKNTIESDDAITKIKEELSEVTRVTKRQIWIFENYTRDNHEEDVERSIEFLDFILHCLDVAEGNQQFRRVHDEKNPSIDSSENTHESSESDSN